MLHALNGACPGGVPAGGICFDSRIVKLVEDAEAVAFRAVRPSGRRRFNVGPRNARRLSDAANRGIACQSTANLSVRQELLLKSTAVDPKTFNRWPSGFYSEFIESAFCKAIFNGSSDFTPFSGLGAGSLRRFFVFLGKPRSNQNLPCFLARKEKRPSKTCTSKSNCRATGFKRSLRSHSSSISKMSPALLSTPFSLR